MPHELPGWAIYVVIALALFCFAFYSAWRSERKERMQMNAERADWKRWCENAEEALAETRIMLAEDASGQVRRNKKGQFESMKEKAE